LITRNLKNYVQEFIASLFILTIFVNVIMAQSKKKEK